MTQKRSGKPAWAVALEKKGEPPFSPADIAQCKFIGVVDRLKNVSETNKFALTGRLLKQATTAWEAFHAAR